MKKNTSNLLIQIALILVSITLSVAPTSAQNAPANNMLKTNSKMLYHGGPVQTGAQDVYFIFYGCWTNTCGTAGDTTTMTILTDFMSSVGNTPYMQINSTYADSSGQPASAVLIYGGSVMDSWYSHGVELTEADIQGIMAVQFNSNELPQDPQGIYVVLASADVSATATGFCTPGAPPFHGYAVINGAPVRYVFLGNPNRCATVAGAQFIGGPTPNGSFAGDAMVTNLAHALNGLLTDPFGDAWYDRYGLENADKCTGTFGQTYTTANGAPANIHLGVRDFLLEQNWVNARKGYCAMFQQ